MRRSFCMLMAAIALLAIMVSGAGCGKKTQPKPPAVTSQPAPAPETPPAPAPTVTLSVSPSAIERGQSATLTWKSTNTTSVTIDNGVGTVEASGSRSVSPSSSTTYMARAAGPGGNAVAEARVTVTEPPPPAPPAAPAISDSVFFETNIRDVYFDYDAYTIRADARAALDANARALKERPGIRITIEGHCDERGSEKYNLALGDRRANAAKEYLVSQGIDSSRIDTTSYGKERNLCEEHSEECWQQNRRAHFVMR